MVFSFGSIEAFGLTPFNVWCTGVAFKFTRFRRLCSTPMAPSKLLDALLHSPC